MDSEIQRRRAIRITDQQLTEILNKFPISLNHWRLGYYAPVCEMVQLAHWHYLDNYGTKQELKKQKLVDFAYIVLEKIFSNIDLYNLDDIFAEWRRQRNCMPRSGAILIDESMSKILLVKTFKSESWMFPSGKMEAGECMENCAIREVFEETGFDISNIIDSNLFIQHKKPIRRKLYLIKNVPESFPMEPRVNNEIVACEWFNVDNLIAAIAHKINKYIPKEFRSIAPFLNQIRDFMNEQERMQG